MQHLTQINISKFFENEKPYRYKQFISGWFNCNYSKYADISNLPKKITSVLDANIDFSTIKKEGVVLKSKDKSCFKSLLYLYDDSQIETVLMKNAKGKYTICVSTQVGCSIKCEFCLTGKMGFIRNLDALEIAEQYLFWKKYLGDTDDMISNIVLMGMGEPLLNYDNVKNAISLWLENSKIGQNMITVSTIGIISKLNEILEDKQWPNVKIAISLHSADSKTRKKLVPFHKEDFFDEMIIWASKYMKILGARNRYLTFEYVIIKDVNDSISDASTLCKFLKKFSRIKVNIIPYNNISDKEFSDINVSKINTFKNILEKHHITVTIRKSMGQDIMAACGQLASSSV